MSSRALRSLSFLLLASGWLDCEGRELPKPEIRQLVARIRRLPANALDPSQPAVPLERWLEETIPSLSPQEWDISDCDLKPNFAESSDIWPLCIVARVSPDPGGFGIRLHIHYVEEVRAQMSEIERRVGEDTCACDGRAGVIRELSAFAKAFPSSPAHVRVVKRLDAIAQGKADVRFNCASE